jgi:predicted phosphate transport protein (TIGR00153 family)
MDMAIHYFSKIFSQSPLTAMQDHMEIANQCVGQLIPFFKSVLEKDHSKAKEAYKEINKLENKADSLNKKLRLHMPKGLFMPVARRDLLELLQVQDRAANQAKDIAGIIVGRKMIFPPKVAELIPDYVKRCVDACKQAKKVIDELDDIEKDTDKMQIKIRSALLKIEKDLPPVDVIFYYKIIEGIGEVADIAQRIGSRVELLLAK